MFFPSRASCFLAIGKTQNAINGRQVHVRKAEFWTTDHLYCSEDDCSSLLLGNTILYNTSCWMGNFCSSCAALWLFGHYLPSKFSSVRWLEPQLRNKDPVSRIKGGMQKLCPHTCTGNVYRKRPSELLQLGNH